MNYNYIFGFILLFTVAFFFGCDDDDGPTGPEGEGSFTVTISGDISRQFSGSAVFAINKEQGEEGFALALAAGEDNEETLMLVSFFLVTGTPPGKGTYVIGESATETIFHSWYNATGEYNEMFFAESGSITVNSSSNTRFAGSFQYTAKGWISGDYETEKEVNITGNFDAVGAAFTY